MSLAHRWAFPTRFIASYCDRRKSRYDRRKSRCDRRKSRCDAGFLVLVNARGKVTVLARQVQLVQYK